MVEQEACFLSSKGPSPKKKTFIVRFVYNTLPVSLIHYTNVTLS